MARAAVKAAFLFFGGMMSVFRLVSAIAFAAICAAAPPALATSGNTKRALQEKNHFVAQSGVNDPSARQIVRTVANETLKTISTKDAASTGAEDGPVLTPTKVEIEDAPGLRQPAQAPEANAAPLLKSEPKNSSSVIAAEQALSWLKNGNNRYLKNTVRKDGSQATDRQRLVQSEKPYAIVLACSDSRIPPETVFDQALGEIYVIRTAGQSIDSAVIASIEHAVQSLDPKLIVVMGHTSCSAVQAAVDTRDEDSAGSPALDALIANIRPRLPNRSDTRDLASPASAGLEIESSANALGAAADLTRKSEILRRRVESGELVIKPALYHLDSGAVKFY